MVRKSRLSADEAQFRSTARPGDLIPATLDAADHAAYIRDMLLELRSMAERNNLIVLAYFLDMAHEEASEQAHGGSDVS